MTENTVIPLVSMPYFTKIKLLKRGVIFLLLSNNINDFKIHIRFTLAKSREANMGTSTQHNVITLNQALESMWQDYCALNPAAKKIYALLSAEGEKVLNDHIALRTFNHPRLGIQHLAQAFLDWGYKPCGEYTFKEKKLFAKHYEHPDETLPKVFISELELQHFSADLNKVVDQIANSISETTLKSQAVSWSGRTWNISHTTYQKLATESEYAAWVAAIGFRPNHFTVNINALKNYSDITVLNEFLESKGYLLNASGGKIKGTPEQLLEQSSTMAETIEVEFSDGRYKVPSCYYEFAKRYAMPNGKLYSGFIAASADKIFESTNRR